VWIGAGWQQRAYRDTFTTNVCNKIGDDACGCHNCDLFTGGSSG
jgi:hypothetical protein